jgi:methionyl aminopeptidase
MIPIKTAAQIERMRVAGRIAATVLARMTRLVAPGVNTYDLDQAGRRFIEEFGARSACFNYPHGNLRFPSYTCLSVNEEVVHGIGDLRQVLVAGDVISIDVSIIHEGWIGDNATTIAVGEVAPRVGELLRETRRALDLAIDQARPGHRVGFISHVIESHVSPKGFGIVRDFVGHGVGRTMHEPPQIPNFGPRKRGERLRPGMTLAIEPMITLGRPDIEMARDGWTARTVDRSPAAHFEHTVLVTQGEPEILTQPYPE